MFHRERFSRKAHAHREFLLSHSHGSPVPRQMAAPNSQQAPASHEPPTARRWVPPYLGTAIVVILFFCGAAFGKICAVLVLRCGSLWLPLNQNMGLYVCICSAVFYTATSAVFGTIVKFYTHKIY